MSGLAPIGTRPSATLPPLGTSSNVTAFGVGVIAPTVQSQIAADMAEQIALVNAAIEAAGTLQTAPLSSLQPAVDVIDAAVAVFDADAVILDGEIDESTMGGVDPAQPSILNVAALLEQTSTVAQLAVLLESRAYLARAAVNMQQATG